MREGLLGDPDNPNGDPEVEPLSKQPFDPQNPECLPYHLPDDLTNFSKRPPTRSPARRLCYSPTASPHPGSPLPGEWPAMVGVELERVVDYVKGLQTMEKTGEDEIDFGSCLKSPELVRCR